MMRIDLNCDVGELPELIANGTQEALLQIVTSANIACGGHAGDRESMCVTVEQARRHGTATGAHPGYPDPKHFGRIVLDLPKHALADSLTRQIASLAEITTLTHVKPHGALYNQAAKDRALARTIAQAVAHISRDLVLVGLAGSVMLDEFAEAGFRTAAEAFADRAYEPDGTLRARTLAGALIESPAEAAAQALALVRAGKADTLCIHSDTPNAVAIANAVRAHLAANGISPRAAEGGR